MVGTLLYMSPEQWRGHADERSDIWSLGVTLCELVTGEAPFKARSTLQLHSEVVSGAPLPLRERFPSLPLGIELVIGKCLKTDSTMRYQNVAELAVALREFGSGRAKPLVDRICRLSPRLT